MDERSPQLSNHPKFQSQGIPGTPLREIHNPSLCRLQSKLREFDTSLVRTIDRSLAHFRVFGVFRGPIASPQFRPQCRAVAADHDNQPSLNARSIQNLLGILGSCDRANDRHNSECSNSACLHIRNSQSFEESLWSKLLTFPFGFGGGFPTVPPRRICNWRP